MKKNVMTLIGILCATMVLANGQFEKAMAKNIPNIYRAEDAASLQNTINQLSRIGDAEGDKWEPYYYAAYGYLRMMGFSEETNEKDGYLDQALETITKGEEISPGNSELESLKGYVHMMRVTIDPATRGMQYSGLAMTSFQKAIAMDESNARAHYLLGRMQYGTAQFMGNGDGGACESFAKAKALFDSPDENANPLAPAWGSDATNEAIGQFCN